MKPLLLAIATTTLVAACATATSPTGRTQRVGAVSQEQLDQLGAQAYQQALAQKPQSRDQRAVAYVRCVASEVIAELPPQARGNWQVTLFEDATPNAFALPGGYIGINTGIFKVAKTQDQLAEVIAHEIGHVLSRHHDERITRQMGAQALLGIGGAIVGSQYGQGAANTVSQVGGAVAQGWFLLPNSRIQETEADVVGQQLMAEAGFDPSAAVDLWQNMIAYGGPRQPEFLSTHPDPRARLDELRQRAQALAPVYQRARASGETPNCG